MVVGVAQDPEPVSPVGRTKRPSTHHGRPAGVVVRFQRREDFVRPASAQVRNVLNQNPNWLDLANEAEHLPPEPTAVPFEAASLAGDRDVLAREAPADEVRFWRRCFNVFPC